jgi:hypothetical protein
LTVSMFCRSFYSYTRSIVITLFFYLVSLMSLYISLNSLPLYAQTKDPILFDLSATLLALNHTQGRVEALFYLLQMPRHQIPLAKHAKVIKSLDQIILDQHATLKERLWSIELLQRLEVASDTLVKMIQKTSTFKNHTPLSQIELIVARAASRALRALGRVDLLTNTWQHHDPVIRASTAAIAADADHLCDLIKDPWREVRLSAILGLGKLVGPKIFCVLPLISNRDVLLAIEASHILGKVPLQDWFIKSQNQLILKKIQSLAHNTQLDIAIRSALLQSLARWNEDQYVQNILDTHLDKHGLIPLSVAAAKSLIFLPLDSIKRKTAEHRLKRCIQKSRSLEVRLHCSYSLIYFVSSSRDTLTSFIQEWADRRGGKEAQAMLQRLQLHLPTVKIEEESTPDIVPALDEESEAGL